VGGYYNKKKKTRKKKKNKETNFVNGDLREEVCEEGRFENFSSAKGESKAQLRRGSDGIQGRKEKKRCP